MHGKQIGLEFVFADVNKCEIDEEHDLKTITTFDDDGNETETVMF